jgi:TolA-binding protein
MDVNHGNMELMTPRQMRERIRELEDQIVRLQHSIMNLNHKLTVSERRVKALQNMRSPAKGRLVHGGEIKFKDRPAHLFVVNDSLCKLCGLPIDHPTHGDMEQARRAFGEL